MTNLDTCISKWSKDTAISLLIAYILAFIISVIIVYEKSRWMKDKSK